MAQRDCDYDPAPLPEVDTGAQGGRVACPGSRGVAVGAWGPVLSPSPRGARQQHQRALQSTEYLAWAVSWVPLPADLPVETRLCHLKVLKIKPKPTAVNQPTSHYGLSRI